MRLLISLGGLDHHSYNVSIETNYSSLKNVKIIRRRVLFQLGVKFRRGALLSYLFDITCMHLIYQQPISIIINGMCISSYENLCPIISPDQLFFRAIWHDTFSCTFYSSFQHHLSILTINILPKYNRISVGILQFTLILSRVYISIISRRRYK